MKLLNQQEIKHIYSINDQDFAGDCVYTTQKHFIDCMNSGEEFEPNGNDYLKSLAVQEAVYSSGQSGMPVKV